MSAAHALLDRLRRSVDLVYREVAKFGVIGLLAFVVDTGVFNLLRHGLIPGLDDKPLTAKTISVFVATVVAWIGNRYWTFRHRRRASLRREFVLFALMNVGGLAVALVCLGVSHYVLGFRSTLADNISGNGIGLVLGTAFRFWAYRTLVFTHEQEVDRVLDLSDHASAAGAGPATPVPSSQLPATPVPAGQPD